MGWGQRSIAGLLYCGQPDLLPALSALRNRKTSGPGLTLRICTTTGSLGGDVSKSTEIISPTPDGIINGGPEVIVGGSSCRRHRRASLRPVNTNMGSPNKTAHEPEAAANKLADVAHRNEILLLLFYYLRLNCSSLFLEAKRTLMRILLNECRAVGSDRLTRVTY